MSHHPSVVKPASAQGSVFRDTDNALAPSGDRRSSMMQALNDRHRALFLGFVIALLPTPAISGPAQMESASVDISLSVAPWHKMQAVSPPKRANTWNGAHASQFCMATNSAAPAMPVILVRLATPSSHVGNQTKIEVCALNGGSSSAQKPLGEEAGQFLLVRAE